MNHMKQVVLLLALNMGVCAAMDAEDVTRKPSCVRYGKMEKGFCSIGNTLIAFKTAYYKGHVELDKVKGAVQSFKDKGEPVPDYLESALRFAVQNFVGTSKVLQGLQEGDYTLFNTEFGTSLGCIAVETPKPEKELLEWADIIARGSAGMTLKPQEVQVYEYFKVQLLATDPAMHATELAGAGASSG